MSLKSGVTISPFNSAFTSVGFRSKTNFKSVMSSRNSMPLEPGSSKLIERDPSSPRVQFSHNITSPVRESPVEPIMFKEEYLPSALHERRHIDEASGVPPVSEVRIPLAAVVEQGLIELSADDWKALYLSTQKDLDHMKHYSYTALEENRLLKRKLIEMQKCLFETRRNKRRAPELQNPWTIPHYGRTSTATPITTSTTEDDESTGKCPAKVLRQNSEASSGSS